METKRILFIEDDVARNQLLALYMEVVLKWKVYWAKSVKEGIDLFNNYKSEIDLILLDLMIPIDDSFSEQENKDSDHGLKSGFIFLDRILKIDPDLKIPVIILTAKFDIQVTRFSDKIKKIIRKPTGIDEIIDEIGKLA